MADSVAKMKLLFTHEVHVVECGGRYYNPGGMIAYTALCNYLHTIKDGVVVLRCTAVDRVEEEWPRVDGLGVTVQAIPEFGRFGALLRSIPRIIGSLLTAIGGTDRYVVRLPGPTGSLVAMALMATGHRYGVEMVGHYGDELKKIITDRGLCPGWLTSIANRSVEGLTRFLVRRGAAVAYRSRYLQELYPNVRGDREWIFSGAQLKGEVITRPRDRDAFTHRPFKIVSIGRLAIGKGYPVLVEAFDRARGMTNAPMTLEMIGDGDEMDAVRRQVEDLGLSDVVSLPGMVHWGPELVDRLNEAPLFELPTLIEGMPRSVIEAMSRGMPVIASDAGGIPELVGADCLVPPGDADALARRIVGLVEAPDELATMSHRSFEASRDHWPAALDAAKKGFWDQVVRYAR